LLKRHAILHLVFRDGLVALEFKFAGIRTRFCKGANCPSPEACENFSAHFIRRWYFASTKAAKNNPGRRLVIRPDFKITEAKRYKSLFI
jgi:hypothetical protein